MAIVWRSQGVPQFLSQENENAFRACEYHGRGVWLLAPPFEFVNHFAVHPWSYKPALQHSLRRRVWWWASCADLGMHQAVCYFIDNFMLFCVWGQLWVLEHTGAVSRWVTMMIMLAVATFVSIICEGKVSTYIQRGLFLHVFTSIAYVSILSFSIGLYNDIMIMSVPRSWLDISSLISSLF